jgi:hypothetical protein
LMAFIIFTINAFPSFDQPYIVTVLSCFLGCTSCVLH